MASLCLPEASKQEIQQFYKYVTKHIQPVAKLKIKAGEDVYNFVPELNKSTLKTKWSTGSYCTPYEGCEIKKCRFSYVTSSRTEGINMSLVAVNLK